MTSAEESVVNQVKAAIEHAGDRLKGFWVHFHFADGTESEAPEVTRADALTGPTQVDVVEQASNGEAVGGGDTEGQAAPEAGEEVSEAPMSKGKRKK